MATLAELKSNGPLWWRVHVFTYDLRFFSQREDSHKRLEAIVDASYLGLPYFSADEVSQLKSTTLDTGKTLEQTIQETLDERLNRRMKKRQESEDYRVCAAHDLAPIFEKAFLLDPKKLDKNKEFVEQLNERGLKGGGGLDRTARQANMWTEDPTWQEQEKRTSLMGASSATIHPIHQSMSVFSSSHRNNVKM